jgi:GNAT superfamily N-acetyltransferase
VIDIRPVQDRQELVEAFALAGAQLPEPLGADDWRAEDLYAHFPAEQSLMLVAIEKGERVGSALAFRNEDGTVGLRILGVAEPLRHRGIGRLLVERLEAEARLLGAPRVALGTEDAVGFWYHLGYRPFLILQWVYDAGLFEAESQVVLTGSLARLVHRRSSFKDVPQLFVELDEPRLDLRSDVQRTVTGCHVGFMMCKELGRIGTSR